MEGLTGALLDPRVCPAFERHAGGSGNAPFWQPCWLCPGAAVLPCISALHPGRQNGVGSHSPRQQRDPRQHPCSTRSGPWAPLGRCTATAAVWISRAAHSSLSKLHASLGQRAATPPAMNGWQGYWAPGWAGPNDPMVAAAAAAAAAAATPGWAGALPVSMPGGYAADSLAWAGGYPAPYGMPQVGPEHYGMPHAGPGHYGMPPAGPEPYLMGYQMPGHVGMPAAPPPTLPPPPYLPPPAPYPGPPQRWPPPQRRAQRGRQRQQAQHPRSASSLPPPPLPAEVRRPAHEAAPSSQRPSPAAHGQQSTSAAGHTAAAAGAAGRLQRFVRGTVQELQQEQQQHVVVPPGSGLSAANDQQAAAKAATKGRQPGAGPAAAASLISSATLTQQPVVEAAVGAASSSDSGGGSARVRAAAQDSVGKPAGAANAVLGAAVPASKVVPAVPTVGSAAETGRPDGTAMVQASWSLLPGQAGRATMQPAQEQAGSVGTAAPTDQPAAPTATAAPTAQRAAPHASLQQVEQDACQEQQHQTVTVQWQQQLKMLPPPVCEEQCPPQNLQPQAPLPHGQPAAQQPQPAQPQLQPQPQPQPQPQQAQAQAQQQEVQAQEAHPGTPGIPAPDQQPELLSREAPTCRAVLGSMFVARGQLERGLADVEHLLLGEC